MKDENPNSQKSERIGITQAVVKWIIVNIALPLSPIVVRAIIVIFTSIDTRIIEPSELLYFSFIIGILLIGSINKDQSAINYIVTYLIVAMCSASLLLIGFTYSGDADAYVAVFSAASAVTCACIGTIYKIVECIRLGRESK